MNGLQRIDGDDVEVIEIARCAGLLEETLESNGIGLGGGELFDGDRAFQEGILRQVDRPEGSLAECACDGVFEKGIARGKRHVCSLRHRRAAFGCAADEIDAPGDAAVAIKQVGRHG